MSTTSFKDVPKSPTNEQQIQPEFISLISTPESFKNPPSIPISPNSFSISTTCSPFNASFNNLLISVVFPAPKKPDIISTFVILNIHLSLYGLLYLYPLYNVCQYKLIKKILNLYFPLPIPYNFKYIGVCETPQAV